jgi:hypothetical protein
MSSHLNVSRSKVLASDHPTDNRMDKKVLISYSEDLS